MHFARSFSTLSSAPTCFLAALALVTASAFAQTPPAAGEWPTAAGDAANTRYSAVEQINAGNVDKLRVAFTFPLGVERGQEAAPIVVGDTMYVVTPFPNWLYALDLKKPDAPLKWKFDPKADPGSQGVAC